MRLFVALVPSDEAVEHLDEFLDVRRAAAPYRWASREQLHLTLAFMGSAQERHLDDLVERLGRAAAKRSAFETRIAGGGAFPSAGRARVLWAGLDLDDYGRTEIDRLATGCRAAAGRAGIAVDGQRFRPHVTVARLGHPAEVSDWVRLLDSYAGPPWTADRIVLVESHLGEGPRGRPRYESVEELALSG
ncbi:2'-5' RNA ligase [Nocardioides sp. Root1257]|uniref:RNA 2',3'-cyclic phosphodiesterase n=1 Tax=unclassified Nocardioides TaxID=2615069 RepID=UPI0006FFCC61|nr:MULTISPECIES: RNA 2',3'-cyclic phosphodiesterase [unclassified Nocardioides]KQW47281.1 2'-5' RNA ligase [Nocardioides sp. Root1257]KRC45437.1 2'-5' RNA ligase [Nocardioides sp. Root224]